MRLIGGPWNRVGSPLLTKLLLASMVTDARTAIVPPPEPEQPNCSSRYTESGGSNRKERRAALAAKRKR